MAVLLDDPQRLRSTLQGLCPCQQLIRQLLHTLPLTIQLLQIMAVHDTAACVMWLAAASTIRRSWSGHRLQGCWSQHLQIALAWEIRRTVGRSCGRCTLVRAGFDRGETETTVRYQRMRIAVWCPNPWHATTWWRRV